jgi:hypothetical protein
VELVQPLTWTWNITDQEFRSAIDAKIQQAFERVGYKSRPGQEYGFITGIDFNPKADMTLTFVDSVRAQAICYECSQEHRGMHIHVFPRTDQKALDDLANAVASVSKSVNRVSLLDYSVSKLTWNYRWIPAIAILAIISYLMTESSKAFSPSSLTILLSTLGTVGFIAIMIYVLLIIPLVIARIVYAYRFNFG